jgi:3-deoxy-D-manno-octulosonate 8-phosphate phosphatase (KDO 8-P phosphatase)
MIRMFGMDVDGVLTDGGIYYGDSGLEIKRFNVQDGMGITLLRKAGIIPFIITARTSEATARRAQELGITETHQGIKNKLACLEELASRHGVPLDDIAFVGDDLADLDILLRVGCPIAVANATEEVKQAAEFVASCGGGAGAVREACEYVIRLNGYAEKSLLKLLMTDERTGDAYG